MTPGLPENSSIVRRHASGLPKGSASIDLSEPFTGYDWGQRGGIGETWWRWLADDKPSVVLLKLAPQRYRIEADIHTARDMEALHALRGMVNRIAVEDQAIHCFENSYKLMMTIDAGAEPIELGFRGPGVALSRLRIEPAVSGVQA